MIPPEMRLKQLETAVGPCAWQPRGSHVHGPADIGNHRIDNENTLGVEESVGTLHCYNKT